MSSTNIEVRRLATTVYTSLLGKSSVPQMRQVLRDSDADLRGIAMGSLAEFRDTNSLSAIFTAAPGITNAAIACAAIVKMAQWGDERLVPALIPFLEVDSYAGQMGDDLTVPALKARKALQDMTGFVFPGDVAVSLSAWNQALTISDPKERSAFLAKALGNWAKPFAARLAKKQVGGTNWVVQLTNVSGQSMCIAGNPTQVEIRDQQSVSSFSGDQAGRKSFVRLEPGGKHEFPFHPREQWRGKVSKGARVKLLYREAGSAFGVKAWVGWLEVSVE